MILSIKFVASGLMKDLPAVLKCIYSMAPLQAEAYRACLDGSSNSLAQSTLPLLVKVYGPMPR